MGKEEILYDLENNTTNIKDKSESEQLAMVDEAAGNVSCSFHVGSWKKRNRGNMTLE